MLGHILKKEILLHLRETRFAWIGGLLCALVLAGMALMGVEQAGRFQRAAAGRTAERRQMGQIDASRPLRNQVRELTDVRGTYAFRSPSELAFAVTGFEEAASDQIHVLDRPSWSRQASDRFYRNPLLALTPRPDFCFVTASVLSLVALFLTFDTVCGEKQAGTLRLQFSYGISRDSVLLAKWAGALVTLGVPFGLATSLGVAGYALLAEGGLSAEGFLRIAGIGAVSALYLSLFVSIGIAISVLARRPSTALLVSLAVWVGLTFVLPQLLGASGALLADAPSFQQIQMRKRALAAEVMREDALLAGRVRRSEITAQERARQREGLQAEADRETAKIDRDYERRIDDQAGLSRIMSRLSPTGAYTFAAGELADTGLGFYRRAHEAFSRYRAAFQTYAKDTKRRADAGDLKAGWLVPEELPVLRLDPQDPREALAAALPDVLVLLLFHALAFALSYVAFLRYDVR